MDINPVLFPPVTNRESWQWILGLNDADTGDPIDLTDLTFVSEIRIAREGGQWGWSSGYSTNYSDVGTDDMSGPVIELSLGSGLTVVDTGMLQISVTVAQMRSLDAGTYDIALTASNGVDTRQVFLGKLPVLFGGVS